MKHPPKEFVDAFVEAYPDVQYSEDWKLSEEWKWFKIGYNACVERANKRTMDKYGVKETTTRVFATGDSNHPLRVAEG